MQPQLMTNPNEIQITTFKDNKTRVGLVVSSPSFKDLYALLVDCQPALAKVAQPLWKGGLFEDNSRAKDKGFLTTSVIIGDYDGGVVTVDEAVGLLTQADVSAFVYTTASHLPEKPRWRVVAKLAHPVPTSETSLYLERLNGILVGCLSVESWVSKQCFYYGPVGGVQFLHSYVQGGRTLHECSEIVPRGKPVEVEVETAKATATLDWPTIATSTKMLEAIESASKFVLAGARADWLTLSYSLASLKQPFGDNSALGAIWLTWTKANPSYKPEDDALWATLVGSRTPISTFLERAREGGWTGKAPTQADEVIAQLGQLNSTEQRASWAKLCARLDEAGTSQVLEALVKAKHPKTRLNAELKEARLLYRKAVHQAALAVQRASRVEFILDASNTALQSEAIMSILRAKLPDGALVQFGDQISYIARQTVVGARHWLDSNSKTPTSWLFAVTTKPRLLALIEQHVMTMRICFGEPTPTQVPDTILKHMLDPNNTNIQKCSGLVAHPVVLEEGTIVQKQGLDISTGLFLTTETSGITRFQTLAEATAGLQRLIALPIFKQFAWATPKHGDYHIACLQAVVLLLTFLNRKLYEKAPLFYIAAAMAGTGKTALLAWIVAIIVGEEMVINPLDADETERRKAILTALLPGPEYIVFDNTKSGGSLVSETLCAISTSGAYQDRILGVSKAGKCTTALTLAITGNNVTMDGDLPTRTVQIDLDANMENPTKRNFVDKDIFGVALAHRQEAIHILVALLAWHNSQPPLENFSMGRFPQWSREIGGCVFRLTGYDVNEVFDKVLAASSDTDQSYRVMSALLHIRATTANLATALSGFEVRQGNGLGDISTEEALCLRNAFATFPGFKPGPNDTNSAKWIGSILRVMRNKVVVIDDIPYRLCHDAKKRYGEEWSVVQSF